MLKVLLFLTCLAAALPASGCQKKATTPPPPVAEINVSAPPVVMSKTEQDKFSEALDQAGITGQRRAELTGELEKQGPKYGFTLSSDKEYVMGLPRSGSQGSPISAVLMEINGPKDGPAPDAANAVQEFCERKAEEVKLLQKETAEKRDQLQRIDQGEIVSGLRPASDPTGDWQSLGETREGEKHFLVQHDDAYYKVLRLNKETKAMSYQEFKEGKLERNTNLPYEYKAEAGQLTTTSAGGGPGDAFIVMELAGFPDRLFVRPMYETVFAFTVYKRVGGTTSMGAPPPPPVTTGVAK